MKKKRTQFIQMVSWVRRNWSAWVALLLLILTYSASSGVSAAPGSAYLNSWSLPLPTTDPGDTIPPSVTPDPNETIPPSVTPDPNDTIPPSTTPDPNDTIPPSVTPDPNDTIPPTDEPGDTIPPTTTEQPEGTSPTPESTPTLPTSDATVTANPGTQALLSYTTADGRQITILIPPEALNQTTTFLFHSLEGLPHPAAGAFRFAGRTFVLDAYQNNLPIDRFAFLEPITIVLEYSDADVDGLNATSLALFYYNTVNKEWSQEGVTLLVHDLAQRQIAFQVDHLTEFALGERINYLYLPLMSQIYE